MLRSLTKLNTADAIQSITLVPGMVRPAKPFKSLPICTRLGSGTRARRQTLSSESLLSLSSELTSSHYDVEINPVVKVANQKKPRQLLWEVWNQMCTDATGELKRVLDASAYDMV
jgi:hypothetical protein